MLLVNMKLIVIYVHFTNQSNESMGHLKCLCNYRTLRANVDINLNSTIVKTMAWVELRCFVWDPSFLDIQGHSILKRYSSVFPTFDSSEIKRK